MGVMEKGGCEGEGGRVREKGGCEGEGLGEGKGDRVRKRVGMGERMGVTEKG